MDNKIKLPIIGLTLLTSLIFTGIGLSATISIILYLLFLFFLIIFLINNIDSISSKIQYSIFLFFFISIGWLLYLNIVNYATINRIYDNKLNSIKIFQSTSFLLVVIQFLYIIFYMIGSVSNIKFFVLFSLLSILNFYLIGAMQVYLQKFVTDG
jgi:hypothetical protein